MKKLAIIISLVILLFLGERQAGYCGQSAVFFTPDIPHGIKVDWFNGSYWVLDTLGFGLITPSPNIGSIERDYMSDTLGIYKILEYAYQDNAYFRVLTTDNNINYVAIISDFPTRKEGLIFFGEKDKPIGFDEHNYDWHSLSLWSCFIGFPLIRVPLFILLLVILISKLRSRKKGSNLFCNR